MQISAPGSELGGLRPPPRQAGFTLIEVMLVMAIVAIATALVSLALRDGTQSRLDEEGARLSALLEAARTEARTSGVAVRWVPAEAGTPDSGGDGAQFRFVGMPVGAELPTRWLTDGVSAEIIGARVLLLGPEPVLPAQQVVLHLDDRRLVLASDGLAPFAPVAQGEAAP